MTELLAYLLIIGFTLGIWIGIAFAIIALVKYAKTIP